jgi:hypothetical protein
MRVALVATAWNGQCRLLMVLVAAGVVEMLAQAIKTQRAARVVIMGVGERAELEMALAVAVWAGLARRELSLSLIGIIDMKPILAIFFDRMNRMNRMKILPIRGRGHPVILSVFCFLLSALGQTATGTTCNVLEGISFY